jgi:hypothetical protein
VRRLSLKIGACVDRSGSSDTYSKRATRRTSKRTEHLDASEGGDVIDDIIEDNDGVRAGL